MKLLIDGDSASKRESAIRIAKKFKIPVHIYCDTNHEIVDDYAEVHFVAVAPESADLAIANHTEEGDIVITNDVGLATLVLAKKGRCLKTNGTILDENNINGYINTRFMKSNVRRKSKRYILKTNLKNIEKNSKTYFTKSLYELIDEGKNMVL